MGHIFLSLIFYNIILYTIYRHYKRGDYYVRKHDWILFTLLFIAYGTYGSGEGDYLQYKENIAQFQNMADVFLYNGMEIQYNYLAYLVGGDNALWRLVVYSIQFVGMSWFLWKANLNTYPILFCFASFCLVVAVYNRAFWGTIYFFMGMYLLIEKRNPLFLISVALCYASHTQNSILFALIPIAFIKLNKWHLFFVLIVISTATSFLHESFESILDSGGIDGADYISDKLKTYSESELGYFGNSIGEYILTAIRYIPMSMILFKCFRLITANRKCYLSLYPPFRCVLNLTIGIVLSSVVILLADLGGGTFFYRVLAMSFFGFSLIVPNMVDNNVLSRRAFNRYMFVFYLANEFSYIKDLYYAHAHGMQF